MNRRQFTRASAAGAAAALLSTMPSSAQSQSPQAGPQPSAAVPPRRLQVGALIHSDMILLDLVGPQTVFNFMSADVHLVGRTRDPVRTDVGVALQPTVTMDECPAELDILFVPGGLTGTVKLMDDKPTLDFLADRGSRAKFVTSVCTGSLLLAAAGLLKGYRATSHWYVKDLLPRMGATVGAERVVVDRNRMTGGGVTAGIDFGLELARTIRDENFAKFVQLFLEYDPHPPVDAGSPEKAGREMADDIRRRRAPLIAAAEEAAIRAGARLKA